MDYTAHKNAHLIDGNMHEAKGFPSASNNYIQKKNTQGVSEWQRSYRQENVLAVLNGYVAATTEVDLDNYAITTPLLDVNSILHQSGNTVRISFTSGYDSTLYSTSSYLQVSGEANVKHNGVFLITTVNASYLEITNTAIGDATEDVASASLAEAYVTHQSYDPENLANGQSIPRVGVVKYNGTVDLWFGDSFITGDCWYNIALLQLQCWNGVSIDGEYKTVTTTYQFLSTDRNLYVDSSAGIFTVTLEASPAEREISIIDKVGSCGASNVTINGNGKNIVGAATALMNSNYISYTMVYNGTQWNIK